MRTRFLLDSAAVKNPQLITEAALKFGSQCVVLSIDAKRSGDSWEVYVNGGRTPTGIDAVEWAVRGERAEPASWFSILSTPTE